MSDTEGAAPKATKRARTAYVQGPIAPIAHPMAGKKLHKKIYKVVKKAADAKALKRGVKEVVKAVRKGDGGLIVIAGDIRYSRHRIRSWKVISQPSMILVSLHSSVILSFSPIDVISHIPVMCEDGALPYVFIQSKVWSHHMLIMNAVLTRPFLHYWLHSILYLPLAGRAGGSSRHATAHFCRPYLHQGWPKRQSSLRWRRATGRGFGGYHSCD